jgi:hypothetical protein
MPFGEQIASDFFQIRGFLQNSGDTFSSQDCFGEDVSNSWGISRILEKPSPVRIVLARMFPAHWVVWGETFPRGLVLGEFSYNPLRSELL